MSLCYRCNKRTEVTGPYRAKTSLVVFPGYRMDNKSHLQNEQVKCCLADISPTSRETLHKENVFERYEYQFLNYIVALIENFNIIQTKSLNDRYEVKNGNARRYDLYLSDGHDIKRASTILLVEVDEKQHWLNPKEYDSDRDREQELKSEFPYAKIYILRIRVNESSKKSCVTKETKKGRKSCIVKPQYSKQFENNMLAIREYIRKIFYKEEKHIYPHAYIDFAKNVGIEEFTGKFPVKKQKEETNELEQLITKIQNTKISDSCKVVIPKTGNICGRQRPCRYHDK